MNALQSLQDIFKNKLFRIPDYQRGYAWNQKQLIDFWEDLINLQLGRNHYTGVLSIREVTKKDYESWTDESWLISDRRYKPYYVVDGQQRLTTIVILIQSLIELIRSFKENQDKSDEQIYFSTYQLQQIKEDYVVVELLPQKIIKSYKFGYESDNPSFLFLKHKIFGQTGEGTLLETFYTLNLMNAKIFFQDSLREHLSKFGLPELEQLFKKLTQNLMFNVYEMNDEFDVFVAFETINNRGKKLSNLELLKNRLIYLTTLYENDELRMDEKISLRVKINDAWKEIYYQLGRNKKNPLNDDDFLNAHWVIFFGYTRRRGEAYMNFLLREHFIPQNIYTKLNVETISLEDYDELTDQIDVELIEADPEDEEQFNGHNTTVRLTPTDIEDYVSSLKSAVVHWYNIWNPINNEDLDSDEQFWLEKLNRLGMGYFRPLIVASFLSKNIDSKSRVSLFKAIERFIFISFKLAQAKTTFGSSQFYRFARKLANGEITCREVIEALENRVLEFYLTYSPDNEVIFFDHEIFRKFLERKFKSGEGYYAWSGLKYFFYEYELSKMEQRGNPKIDWKLFTKNDKDKVSIEHIFPQTNDKKRWPEFYKPKISDVHRKLYSGLLGNLLPLSMSINSSLQNASFLEKKNARYQKGNHRVKQGYSDGSHSEIEVSQKKDWTPNEIVERSLKLLKFMDERWDIKFEDLAAMKELISISLVQIQKSK